MPRKNGSRNCDGHTKGFAPTAVRRFDPDCTICVERYGHLPPGERDRPPAQPRFTFTNYARTREHSRRLAAGRAQASTSAPSSSSRTKTS